MKAWSPISLLRCALPCAFLVACSADDAPDDLGRTREAVVLINATFDSGSNGFAYADDVFGTSVPNAASGMASGGQLHVTLGQAPNSGANSGGWSATFSATGPVSVSFFYSLQHPDVFEAPECAEVRVRIDGTAYGSGGNPYVVRICDGGNTSGTFTFTSNSLPAGMHTLTIGGYLNSNSFSDEISQFHFDNVLVDGNATSPVCGDASCNGTETCSSCPADCGACPPSCGDASCNGTETCASCPGDCGACTGGAFIESGGQVVMEAESFSSLTPQGGHTWVNDTASSPSGGQARRADPNSGTARDGSSIATMSPRLDYPVMFSTTGTYQVWVRGRDPGPSVGTNDSVHVGANNAVVSTADRMNGFNSNFNWRRSTLDGVNATLSVPSAGLRTINVWMREDGFVFDKILLTRNASFVPSGVGPAESPRTGACGDMACNGTETCSSCPGDCGACPPVCGDATCNGSETCTSCPGDCGACPPVCGDMACNGTETCATCPGDCGACPSCGDMTCNGTENCTTCPGDCGACTCGDMTCNGSENCTNCPGDCGVCSGPGLDTRPPNPTCVAPPPITTGYTLNRVWPNLTFVEPLGLVQAPGDNAWFYVLEKTGRMRAIPSNNNAVAADTRMFLDLSSVVVTESEGGLLGAAFHPDYATNRFVFVSYTRNVNNVFTSRLSRFQSTDNGLTLNPSTEVVILDHPKTKFNHNAGNIGFGPDGNLYMSLGDDAYQDFTRALMAADPNTWFGKVLRINVTGVPTYTIPPDNPFAAGGGRPEVFAYGLRNPWRFSFDRQSGDLWLADVGEDTWEEVNLIQNGGFYGWPHREGNQCRPGMNCSLAYTGPEHAYGHSGPASITGGYVYRGAQIPALDGHYIYGDYITGEVWAYDLANHTNQTIDVGGGTLSAWGQGNDGELYAIRYSVGIIERLERIGGAPTEFPALITETGCVNPQNPTELVGGAIPYSIAVPFWSDGVDKERYLALPNGTTINIDSSGDWILPPGGVTIKNFRHQGQLFETRFFVRHSDGSYSGYTYEWNTEQTQATLVPPGGKVRELTGLTWTYPSRSGCFSCHTDVAGASLGIETRQLNIPSLYPSTGRTANQLATLEHVEMLSGNLTSLAPLPSSDNTTVPVQDRAKAYLHVNCSNCHRPSGPGRGPMDARFDTPFSAMRMCNEPPTLGDLGVPGAMLLKPGFHTDSVSWLRMSQRVADFMPPLASAIPDAAGAALLAEWIDGIASCPAPPPTVCTVAGNKVANCDFSAGMAPWTLRLNGGSGSASIVSGELQLVVTNPGTLDWHVQDIQILGPLTTGDHELSFDARAASPRNIVVNVGEEGEDYTSFCQQSVALTTTMTRYTIACNAMPNDDNVKLDFNVGHPGTATVFVDNVYFGSPR